MNKIERWDERRLEEYFTQNKLRYAAKIESRRKELEALMTTLTQEIDELKPKCYVRGMTQEEFDARHLALDTLITKRARLRSRLHNVHRDSCGYCEKRIYYKNEEEECERYQRCECCD